MKLLWVDGYSMTRGDTSNPMNRLEELPTKGILGIPTSSRHCFQDENGILNSFLFYLFSYDDDYVCVENAFCVDEGCLERKVDVHPNDLTPFLVVPTSSDLITSFLVYLATLKYGNTLDETHVLHTFLYYLFAFDDVHVDV
ncbi:hypothetical protein FXO38_16456 [Capsicum annuum]|nr:hypothetical protein FXO38_16456 [Capsicum annuum]KAF3665752.1 hypothetical protein FXO37_10895 [Capsicum annuum]